jgi:hypothetical protein
MSAALCALGIIVINLLTSCRRLEAENVWLRHQLQEIEREGRAAKD